MNFAKFCFAEYLRTATSKQRQFFANVLKILRNSSKKTDCEFCPSKRARAGRITITSSSWKNYHNENSAPCAEWKYKHLFWEYCISSVISLFSRTVNPIQDGLFRGCSRIGEGAFWPPSLKSATHILQWWNLAQSYLT